MFSRHTYPQLPKNIESKNNPWIKNPQSLLCRVWKVYLHINIHLKRRLKNMSV